MNTEEYIKKFGIEAYLKYVREVYNLGSDNLEIEDEEDFEDEEEDYEGDFGRENTGLGPIYGDYDPDHSEWDSGDYGDYGE
jgi:hypothetical protein